ncbi:transmembrane component BioN of energizing module of biotin ECF transporter [Cutibacterium acnes JCM 18920]|nr:transmembrane component BioN of energizing module of biotin ECF transporter [Cutibacterium acnes JCM 18920]
MFVGAVGHALEIGEALKARGLGMKNLSDIYIVISIFTE